MAHTLYRTVAPACYYASALLLSLLVLSSVKCFTTGAPTAVVVGRTCRRGSSYCSRWPSMRRETLTPIHHPQRTTLLAVDTTELNAEPLSTITHYADELQRALDDGIPSATSFYEGWEQGDVKEVDVLTTLLEPKAAVVPGQRTLITLPEQERHRIIASFKANKAAVVFIGWVEAIEGEATSQTANLISFAGAAMITDWNLFDKSGELGVEIIGRCKILDIVEVDSTKCLVKLIPHRDLHNTTDNSELSKANIRALHSLYDRCNKEEAVYRELQGMNEIAELVTHRPKLHEKVEEQLSRMAAINERVVEECTSFCAMDYHIDHRARVWSVELQDTDTRLSLVKSALEEKLKKLKLEVKAMKADV